VYSLSSNESRATKQISGEIIGGVAAVFVFLTGRFSLAGTVRSSTSDTGVCRLWFDANSYAAIFVKADRPLKYT
jgi:hypothetical protein